MTVQAPRPFRARWALPLLLQSARAALASGLSWFVAADALGNSAPVFAPLAALLTVQVTIWESVSRGLQRVLGVIVGVLVAYGFARLVGLNTWSITLTIFVAFIAGRLLRLGQQGSVQVPVSALLVLALGATTKGYASDRVADTALGAAFGILANVVIVSRPTSREAAGEVRRFADALSALLQQLAAGLSVPGEDWTVHLAQARRLTDQAAETAAEVEHFNTALRWNPIGRRYRQVAEPLRSAVTAITRTERVARGIARSLAEMPAGAAFPAALAGPLAQLLRSVAADVEAWADELTGGLGGDGAPSASPGAGPRAARRPEAPGPEESPSLSGLYHSVLASARSAEVPLEVAAIASAVALDANRIAHELHEPAPPGPEHISWRSIFGQ